MKYLRIIETFLNNIRIINKTNNMEKVSTAIGALVLGAFLIFLGATLSGTILWCIYPHIFDLFPNASNAGILAPTMGWWNAVCVTWIAGILWKSSNSNTNNNEKK